MSNAAEIERVAKKLAQDLGRNYEDVLPEVQKGFESASHSGFAEKQLGFSLYPKQREALDALNVPGSLVSFCSCNGGGKTSRVILAACLAHLVLRNGKVIATSGSWAQLKDQLMPMLKSFEYRFKGLRVLEDRVETGDPNSFLHAVSTNDAGKFEGHHGTAEHPLMLIYDESKTVKDAFFQAGDRCRIPREHCRILYTSSTGFAQGVFYLSQTDPNFGLTHPPIRQRASECPHISKAEIESIRKKWGADHPLVRSMLDCEFMPFVQGAIIQLGELDALLADPPPFEPSDTKVGFDAAWSESADGDETVVARRQGNRVRIEAAFRERGLHATAGRLVGEFIKMGLTPMDADIIEGDNGGEGSLLIDQLHKMGWHVRRANFGEKPRFNDRYQNLCTEMWVELSMLITQRKLILPADTELYGQLLNRRIVPNNRGLLAIESKLAMKDPNREGGPVRCSPDRADAVVICCARLPNLKTFNLQSRNMVQYQQNYRQPEEQPLERDANGYRF